MPHSLLLSSSPLLLQTGGAVFALVLAVLVFGLLAAGALFVFKLWGVFFLALLSPTGRLGSLASVAIAFVLVATSLFAQPIVATLSAYLAGGLVVASVAALGAAIARVIAGLSPHPLDGVPRSTGGVPSTPASRAEESATSLTRALGAGAGVGAVAGIALVVFLPTIRTAFETPTGDRVATASGVSTADDVPTTDDEAGLEPRLSTCRCAGARSDRCPADATFSERDREIRGFCVSYVDSSTDLADPMTLHVERRVTADDGTTTWELLGTHDVRARDVDRTLVFEELPYAPEVGLSIVLRNESRTLSARADLR